MKKNIWMMNFIEKKSINDKLKEKGALRFLFQNLLINFFIIMLYFYFSELYGSISTIYINSKSFTLQFGITLVIFTLLAKFFGIFHGIIAGILGELIYQLAFYDVLHFEWCIIVGFYGFFCGFYKYKPLKYQKSKNFLLTIISLLISSLLCSLFIILVFSFLYLNFFDPYVIFIAQGFQFLIQTIISTSLIVPTILYLYDKYLARTERQIYTEFLTHHPLTDEGVTHTFYLRGGQTKIYLCSRCSGLFLGFFVAFFFTHLMEIIYKSYFSPELAILLCIILPIPGLVDWSIQAVKIHSSNTERRLLTGFLIGFALHMIAFTRNYYLILLLILLIYFTIFFYFVYLKQKRIKKSFEREVNSFSDDEE